MSRMDKLFDEINGLKARNESNTLSISFIDALLLQVLSNLLFQSFKILSDINYPIRKKNNAKQFIFNILTDDVFDYIDALEKVATKSHQKSSIHVFKFTSGSIMHLMQREFPWLELDNFTYLILKYRLVDWKDNPKEFSSQTEFNFSTWSWWLFNKLPTRNLFEKPYLWDEVTNNLNITESSSMQILELYPFHINTNILGELDKFSEQGLNNEGVLFDICKALKFRNEENNFNFLRNTKEKIKTENGFISLCDWIDWTKQRQDHLKSPPEGQLIFDPRLTEWAALEIIVRVAKCVQEKIESISFFDLNEKHEYTTSIHPNNFVFSNEVINTDIVGLTWEKTRAIFDHPEFKVEFKTQPNLVKDLRYVPSMHLISQSEKVEACINGLGSLLVCLLAKSYFLPSKWNPLGHQLTWTNLYREKLRDVPISSFTRNILDGCFSKKNKETKFQNTFQIELSFIPDDDTLNDPPDFFDISDFISYILKSKENLEMQQISVANHQPRQLTPINLKMFRRNNHQENYNNDN